MASPLKSVLPGPIFLAGWQNSELSPFGTSNLGFLFPLVWERFTNGVPSIKFSAELGNLEGFHPDALWNGERWLSQFSLWFYTTDGLLATRDFVSSTMLYVKEDSRYLVADKREASPITFTWNDTTQAMEIKSEHFYLQWTSNRFLGGWVVV